MIAEAVDTARTLAIALLVWIAAGAAVVTVALYAVAAAVWAAWRGLSGAVRAAGALRALRAGPGSPDAPEGRVRPRPARVPHPDTGTTGPSRRTARCCAASHGGRGGFHVPTTPGPPRGHTGLSIKKESA